ncbi:MAG: acyl-CoA/acyl-ACP dehydrogenase [Alphaproteobacteria bacterium]|nr:acyl-CoA/acyl-ACP dehydrogenase [Alphaproteobacteria bacterium]
MNLDFSDDQKMLKDQARKVLSEKSPPGANRAVLEGTAPYDAKLWAQVGELGWLGCAIPEAYGGLGLGYLELCVIAEELGRAIAPVPVSSSIYLAAEAILRLGTEEQKQAHLPRLAAGEVVGTLALAEGVGVPRPERLETRLEGGRLTGRKIAVPDGLGAGLAVVAAREGQGVSIALVDLSEKGVGRAAERSIDPSRKSATLTFEGARAERLGPAGEGWAELQAVLSRAAVLVAFEQVGGADACLAIARDYALSRYAFGRLIGSFQAIKHKLADMYTHTELARSNAYYAAWALSTDAPELPLAAASARVSASHAFDYAAKEMLQTLGGMGITWEADGHLYLRRAAGLRLLLGAPRGWKERLVRELERRNAA